VTGTYTASLEGVEDSTVANQTLFYPYTWDVRHFREGDVRETRVSFGPDGITPLPGAAGVSTADVTTLLRAAKRRTSVRVRTETAGGRRRNQHRS
jgi:hypothetical protein